MTDPLLFLIAVATLLGTPGPTNTLMATAGAARGIGGALPLLAGELAGYLLSIFAIRVALAPLVATSPALGIAVKIAVAAYLAWLAIKMWRSAGAMAMAGGVVGLREVFITTLLNPKALIFGLSIIPHEHPMIAWYFAGFAALVLVAGTGWIVIGHVLNAAAGRHARIIPRIAAVALVGFAGLVLRSVV